MFHLQFTHFLCSNFRITFHIENNEKKKKKNFDSSIAHICAIISTFTVNSHEKKNFSFVESFFFFRWSVFNFEWVLINRTFLFCIQFDCMIHAHYQTTYFKIEKKSTRRSWNEVIWWWDERKIRSSYKSLFVWVRFTIKCNFMAVWFATICYYIHLEVMRKRERKHILPNKIQLLLLVHLLFSARIT